VPAAGPPEIKNPATRRSLKGGREKKKKRDGKLSTNGFGIDLRRAVLSVK